jgi:hypothetical protein
MFRIFMHSFWISALVVLTGCATAGLDKKATTLDLSKESIAVFTANMTNTFKPSYKLGDLKVSVVKQGTTTPIFYGSGTIEAPLEDILVSIKLDPGKYDMNKIFGGARGFLINGVMLYSLNGSFEVPAQSVVYLGHLKIVNKERSNPDDQASGDVLPLIDQAVAGFANGVLDINLIDRFERDNALFKDAYPALKNISIVRSPIQQLSIPRANTSKAEPLTVTLESAK